MGTNCKLIYGYVNKQTGWWCETEAYYRHFDSHDEEIIPLLQKHKADMTTMSEDVDKGHRFEKLKNSYDGVTRPDYLYYIDISNQNEIKVTVLEDDMEFYRKYGISNYSVYKEVVII